MNWFYAIDQNSDATEVMVFTHADPCAEQFRRELHALTKTVSSA